MNKLAICVIVFSFYYLNTFDHIVVFGQSVNETELSPDWSYCFEFTWIGPEFTNYSLYNGSCTDFTDDFNIKDAPCADPLVVTFDGSKPDIDYLWQNHQRSVICKRSDTQVCAKYTYSFNGQLQNASYMCTKVLSIEENKAETGNTCYKQKIRGYDVEICICKSGTGLYFPCNSAWSPLPSLWTGAIILFSLMFI